MAEVRCYKPGDETQIVPELINTFDEWQSRSPVALEFWRWLYTNQPQISKNISVAVDKDKIIGAMHGVCLQLKIGKEVKTASYGADAYIKKEYRGQGLLRPLRKLRIDYFSELGADFYYLFTDNPILIEFQKKEANSFPFTISRYLRIKDVDLHTKTKSSPNPLLSKIGYHLLQRLHAENIEQSEEIQINKITYFDDSIEDFCTKISDYYDYLLVRNKAYLKWRYCDSPINYTIFMAQKDEKILGYIVLGVMSKQPNYPEGYVIDLLTLPEYPEAKTQLLNTGSKYLEDKGVNAIHHWAIKNNENEAILNKCGFIDSKTNNQIFYMSPFENDPLKPIKNSSEEKIHLSYGDLFLI